MKYILMAFLFVLCSCTTDSAHRIGALVATVYKVKEGSMPLQYKVAAKVAYRVLSVVTAGDEASDIDSINALIDKYGEVHQLTPEQIALAKVTFGQVYSRAKVGEVGSVQRLERLRHLKSGIDSIVN